jgi:hypothetical protein
MKKVTLYAYCLVGALFGGQSAIAVQVPQCNPDDLIEADIFREDCPFYDSLPKCYTVLAESGEELLRVRNRSDLDMWVRAYSSKIDLCDMLMQLVLASRNFKFFFKTGKALGDKGFMNSLLACYQREGAAKLLDPWGQEKSLTQLVDICESDVKLTIFDFIQTAFSLSDDVCQYEEKSLGISFLHENDETIRKFMDIYTSPPRVISLSSPSLFLKVHWDVCRCCREKVEEYRKDCLTRFSKYDQYEEIIGFYIKSKTNLPEELLALLCEPYSGRGLWPLRRTISGPDGGTVPPHLGFRTLQKVDLFKIAAHFGLDRTFGQLILCDEAEMGGGGCFREELEDILEHVIDGGHLPIMHICEEKEAQFSRVSDFRAAAVIAYGNSAGDTLSWMIENHLDSAATYSSVFNGLVDRFYNSPVTVSKTLFLLNILDRCCPTPVVGNYFYQREIAKNIVPLTRYLVEKKGIPTQILLGALSYRGGSGCFINASTARYFIDQRDDFYAKMEERSTRDENLGFLEFLRRETQTASAGKAGK